jgi:Tol biopolymer transport system component
VVLNEPVASSRFAPSPDRRLIAAPGLNGIVLYSLSPFAQVEEIPGALYTHQPETRSVWSSDSKQLLFMRDVCTAAETFNIRNIETGQERALTRSALLAPISFTLSPNDRTVAFAPGLRFYVMPLDGSEPPRLIFEPTHAPVTPSWSPDGRFIAFARYFGGYGRCS